MFNKLITISSLFFIFFLNIYADERQLIVNQLIGIENITFDFEQNTKNKKEMGTCILVFNNKLSCDYEDSMQKRLLINDKTLVVQQKRYDKTFFYPISNSPFVEIFNKSKLINFIKKSNYQLNDNIELTYVGKNKEQIIIFFEKDSYDLAGWKVVDQFQNIIYFSIKIKYKNSKINNKIFEIPSIN